MITFGMVSCNFLIKLDSFSDRDLKYKKENFILVLIEVVVVVIIIVVVVAIVDNGNMTEWSPIRSVIIRVINKIG